MTDKLTPEQDALALRGLHFIQTVTDMARAAKLPPEFVLTLFGAFAKKVVDSGIDTGGDPEAEIEWATRAFLRGMGLDVGHMHRIDPEGQH
jgi:hypothetical protein